MIEMMAAILAGASLAEPMLDGRCEEYADIAPEADSIGVKAHVRETAEHVWLCFSVPEGSYASVDLEIAAPALQRPLNLHASAQLGEWPAGSPAPSDASSSDWWQLSGWWASTTPFNGAVSTPGGRRLNFRTVTGREFQLSKKRFGAGRWRLRAELADVAVAPGDSRSVHWPKTGHHEFQVR